MTEQFQKNIQNWVTLDNQIKNLQQEIKSTRNNRNYHKSNFTYAEKNNLENSYTNYRR